jgi:phenylacetic acid degradation operon negative regulatory protein
VKKVTAKRLILDVLLANQGRPITAKQAIAACGIFNISVNNTRVTLVRLSAEGLVESLSRASYQLTEDSHTLIDNVVTWRTLSDRVRSWDGSFVLVRTSKLSKRISKQQTLRNRALMMMGFQPLDKQLYIRPNNLEPSVEAVRARLYKLGLDKESSVFCANQFDEETIARITNLWKPKELEESYKHFEQKIETWLKRHKDLDIEVAARESFLLGNTAVKHVIYDPLLPREWLDPASRNRFFKSTQKLDDVGRGIWKKLWIEKEI